MQLSSNVNNGSSALKVFSSVDRKDFSVGKLRFDQTSQKRMARNNTSVRHLRLQNVK